MGACFDELTLDGSLSESQVKKAFSDYQHECDVESGQSYSGRLNMCRGIEFASIEFDSESKAWEYLQNKCQKWENAIAVRCKVSNPIKTDAKLVKLQTARKDLEQKLYQFDREKTTVVSERLKAIEFIKCPHCKSRMDTRFRSRTLKCPICDGSFLSKSDLKKLESMRNKIKDLTAKIDAHCDVLQAKANKNKRNLRWLVGGLCSS